jgi:hypothetical protein
MPAGFEELAETEKKKGKYHFLLHNAHSKMKTKRNQGVLRHRRHVRKRKLNKCREDILKKRTLWMSSTNTTVANNVA